MTWRPVASLRRAWRRNERVSAPCRAHRRGTARRACAYRINIEIVRWLVHEQQVAARAQQLRELHAVPLTARQVGHLWGKERGEAPW